MRKMDPREAESLFGKVRGFELGKDEDFPLVPLVYPADAASRVRQRFGSAKTQSSSHKSTAILVGSIASAALYSASKALRN
jgi:hypothetical protein